MANAIDDALDRLADALSPLLDAGRVSAEPRTMEVGPSIWVELPNLSADRPQGANFVTADFPVWISTDGADRAQVGFLNEAVAQVWAAASSAQACWPQRSTPVPTNDTDHRAVVVTVRMQLMARGMCPPDPPTPIPVPPDPITEE